MFNKKASLEISIQAIVIVVLAMTLLGLGLGFIKGMFSNISSLSAATFDKIADQMNRDLVNGNEKLLVSQTKITIQRGGSQLLGWGIKNGENSKLDYRVEFRGKKCPTVSGPVDCTPADSDVISNWFTYKSALAGTYPYFAEAASQKVERVDLSIPKTAPDGTAIGIGLYLIELTVLDQPGDTSGSPWATADLFITVT